jgi:hypothetical protein
LAEHKFKCPFKDRSVGQSYIYCTSNCFSVGEHPKDKQSHTYKHTRTHTRTDTHTHTHNYNNNKHHLEVTQVCQTAWGYGPPTTPPQTLVLRRAALPSAFGRSLAINFKESTFSLFLALFTSPLFALTHARLRRWRLPGR